LVILGEIAHIIAERRDGPRGDQPMSVEERNRASNLMLLCQEHHQLVDSKPAAYSIERLRAMKTAHEQWVETRLGQGVDDPSVESPSTTDTLYSTLLPVEQMPRYIYGAPTSARFERDVTPQALPGRVTPFILHDSCLWAFQNLHNADGPFAASVDITRAERIPVDDWLKDADHERLVQQLLNRCLNKLTGHRGLHLDKEHHRYYFSVEEEGTKRTVAYRPLNKDSATRSVVWQPTRKSDGTPAKYWLHRAVGLHFLLLNRSEPRWVLSVRPELRVTADGVNPYPSKAIGRRVTKTKSRLFNYDLLGELQFWRDYLSDSRAHIVLRFTNEQILSIATSLLDGTVVWPGIPTEHDRPFQNVHFVDDLFSWAETTPDPNIEDPNDWDDDTDDFENE
jgi:hypothetical protein